MRAAAAAIHVGVYDFVRVYQPPRLTPAMAAEACETHGPMEDFAVAITRYAPESS